MVILLQNIDKWLLTRRQTNLNLGMSYLSNNAISEKKFDKFKKSNQVCVLELGQFHSWWFIREIFKKIRDGLSCVRVEVSNRVCCELNEHYSE